MVDHEMVNYETHEMVNYNLILSHDLPSYFREEIVDQLFHLSWDLITILQHLNDMVDCETDDMVTCEIVKSTISLSPHSLLQLHTPIEKPTIHPPEKMK